MVMSYFVIHLKLRKFSGKGGGGCEFLSFKLSSIIIDVQIKSSQIRFRFSRLQAPIKTQRKVARLEVDP